MAYRKVSPSKVKMQASGIKENLKGIQEALDSSKPTIYNFINDKEMKGSAWDAVKRQLNAYGKVVAGACGACDVLIEDCETLVRSVGNEELDEERLLGYIEKMEKIIRWSEERIEQLKNIAHNYPTASGWAYGAIKGCSAVISGAQKVITICERKIEVIDEIEKATDELFKGVDSLLTNLESGMADIKRSGAGHSFTMSNNPEWMSRIDDSLKYAFVEAIKNAKGAKEISSVYTDDPINLSTGNFIYEKVDLSIGGRNRFDFVRFYNSMDGNIGVFGKGWIHNYEVRVELAEKSGKIFARVICADGREERYVSAINGKYACVGQCTGSFYSIENGYCYESDGATKYVFNNKGQCTKHELDDGTYVDLIYEGKLLTRIQKSTGEYYRISYDNGYISVIEDHANRKIRYEYNNDRITKLTLPNGGGYRYEYDVNGYLCRITNALNVVTVANTFDSRGRVLKQLFPDGSETSLIYRDESRAVIQNERNGRKSIHYHDNKFRNIKNEFSGTSENFEYNLKGYKSKITDRNGLTSFLYYDAQNNIIRKEIPNGRIVETTYTTNNKPEVRRISGKIIEKNKYVGHLLSNTEDAIGRVERFLYGKNGLPVEIMQPDKRVIKIEYDEHNNISSLSEAEGGKTSYKWDNLNRLVEITEPSGSLTSFEYDVMGNVTRIVMPDGGIKSFEHDLVGNITKATDAEGGSTTIKYNVLGRPEEVTDPMGRVTRYEYNSLWDVKKVVLPNGGMFEYDYDEMGRVTTIIMPDKSSRSFLYDGNGNITSITDGNGNKTNIKYDIYGNVIRKDYPNGAYEEFRYDEFGNLENAIDMCGGDWQYSYDEAGQLLKRVDPIGNCVKYTYTQMGDVETITDEDGATTSYEYYSVGKPKRVIFADGTSIEYKYDTNGRVNEYKDRSGYRRFYTYNSMSLIEKISGENGEAREFEYDKNGNIIRRKNENEGVSQYSYSSTGKIVKTIDELGNVAEYEYDDLDSLTKIKQYGSENKSVQVTSHKNDLLGRVISITNPLGNTEYYEYDGLGNLIKKIDKDGFETQLSYDSMGYLDRISYADGKTTEFKRDPSGNLTELVDWTGTTSIIRDDMSRVNEVRYPDGEAVTYTYTAGGRKASITYPDGNTVDYSYDKSMRLSGISENDSFVLYEYDEFGRVINKRMNSGATVAYQYDKLGRLSRLLNMIDNRQIDSIMYEYDAMSNIVSLTKERDGYDEDSGQFSYAYDAVGRITSVMKGDDVIRTYDYDAFGNRTALITPNSEITYFYNEVNQLISKSDGLAEQRYSYDKRGNLIEVESNGESLVKMIYGPLGRLEKVINRNGDTTEYVYNGLDNRVKEKTGTEAINYLNDITRDHNNLLQIKKSEEVQTVVWSGLRPVAVYNTSEKGWNHLMEDHLGSPMRYVDPKGELLESYGFDEFGIGLQFNPDEYMQPFGFTGYMNNSVSKSYFAQARQYMPRVGRFCGEDIIKGNLEELTTLNRYTYCYNNPEKYVDYSGNKPSPSLIDDTTSGSVSQKGRHYNRNIISYNGNTSQEQWIKEYGEENIIRDAMNQVTVDSPNKRNKEQDYIGTWRKASDSENKYHVSTNSDQGYLARFNKKYLYHNEDGTSYEVIIGINETGDYYVVHDDTNGGTFNISDPVGGISLDKSSVDHFQHDIWPYYKWGNNSNDKFKIERFRGSKNSCID